MKILRLKLYDPVAGDRTATEQLEAMKGLTKEADPLNPTGEVCALAKAENWGWNWEIRDGDNYSWHHVKTSDAFAAMILAMADQEPWKGLGCEVVDVTPEEEASGIDT